MLAAPRRRSGAQPAYRVFDEHGDVLALRADMTVPIARVVATRYPTAEPPLRFCYFAHAYRGVRPHRGQMREFLQAGIELIGAPGARRHGRGADGAVRTRSTPSASRATASAWATPRCTRRCWTACGVDERARASGCSTSSRRATSSGSSARSATWAWRGGRRRCWCASPQLRGGPERARRGRRPGGRRRCAACARPRPARGPRSPSACIFDLGLARDLGYYTGAVFDVYDPALGAPLGGGGRYDDLLGRFGRDLPAVGFALDVDRLHLALAGRGARERAIGLDHRRAPRRAASPRRSTLSTRIGVDTAEVRSNDRKLLFGDVGIVTMRPSDVPTYVEAGAADVGITGKDVLMEQPSARSTSCSTSATAAARWCSPPSPASPTRRSRRCGAWASMRVATKYPRIAAR